MKIKFFLAIVVMMFSTSFSYASFPVERANSNNSSLVVSQADSDELVSPAAAKGGKSQIVAALLCWFVGIIGIHRFYLGYTWQGIVQILTLGGLGIWTLIDFIRILMGTLEPKNGPYEKTF
ncbi:MAG: TM2 domain-containing protein [Flavobacterium sp.]|jgi:hypothetical protein|uniref:TM2 domain-containing protein n=1 Tax=Flavobacterium sp. TaxID=239 RepID=UPI003BA78A93